jgi:hypothetical protein
MTTQFNVTPRVEIDPGLPREDLSMFMQQGEAIVLDPQYEASGATSEVAKTSLLDAHYFDQEAMTPEALMVYVSTRVGALDEQMDQVFDRQNLSEKVRKEIRGIQETLTNVKQSADLNAGMDMPKEISDKIRGHIAALTKLDEKLGVDVQKHLEGEGQILSHNDPRYNTSELENTRTYLGSVSKSLESSAQMDMIQLQSFMSSRQTAIQLATNLIAALGETQKSVVTNIR